MVQRNYQESDSLNLLSRLAPYRVENGTTFTSLQEFTKVFVPLVGSVSIDDAVCEVLDRQTMLLWLRNRQSAGESLIYGEVCLENRDYALAIRRTFGSWKKAVETGSTES